MTTSAAGFHKVYDLRDRPSHLRDLEPDPPQRREFRRNFPRMVSEHGPPGPLRGGKAIADGRISLRTVEGRIVRVYKTGLPSPDWPEFEVDSNGERTSWNCAASGTPDKRVAALRLFEAGRPVRIVYVLESLERPVAGKQFVKTEVEIWIG